MNTSEQPPVITIDGPGGSGKGTISQLIAQRLGWHFLDSGSLYRILSWYAMQHHIGANEVAKLTELALTMQVQFQEDPVTKEMEIIASNHSIKDLIRSEACGELASQIGVHPSVRTALLEKQRSFRQWPGLVTDGRDMGTVIFPDAELKVFLDASPEERAQRRFSQLQRKGIHASLEQILHDIKQRDQRDRDRLVAPLKPAVDATIIDTTQMTIEEVFLAIMSLVQARFTSLG